MSKKKYRYFFSFLEGQERWLNKMAGEGYRLVRTAKLMYEFEPCVPGEYQYCVEFVGEKSWDKLKEYREFMEEMGYRTFSKNLQVNYSIGKVRWRPWGSGAGQISTNPGTFNRELLILEKKSDGAPFELHTTASDLAAYYRPLRNAYFTTAALLILLPLILYLQGRMAVTPLVILMCVGLILLLPVLFYSCKIHRLNSSGKLHE